MDGRNWSLKDDIREYWSERAKTFDLSPGHEIFGDDERIAWHQLIVGHLGDGRGRKVLDLASGTGVISRLLCECGFSVTGLDFSEAMIDRAKDKARERGLDARYVIGDAEDTRLPDCEYDAIMTRHLVWTLPDPASAFADWFRVLKPGGQVLIIDADTTARTFKSKLLQKIAALLKKLSKAVPSHGVDMTKHNKIVSLVHFSGGARAEDIATLLKSAGFVDVVIDRDHSNIRHAQARHMPMHQCLSRAAQDRYAISAVRPPILAGAVGDTGAQLKASDRMIKGEWNV